MSTEHEPDRADIPDELRSLAATFGSSMKQALSSPEEGVLAAIYLAWLFMLEANNFRPEQAAAKLTRVVAHLTDQLIHDDQRDFTPRAN